MNMTFVLLIIKENLTIFMVHNCTFVQSLYMNYHINRLKKERSRTISAISHEYDFMILWENGLVEMFK